MSGGSIAERRIVVNRWRGAIAGLLLVALGRPAAAHPEFNPVVVNRYVKLTLTGPDELRLTYTVMYGDAPAAVERKAADQNADGQLDDAESRALGVRLSAELTRGLTLTVDGAPVAPAFAPPQVGLAGAEVGPSPFSVDLSARIPLRPAPGHTVRFDDTTPVPMLGETELRLEESPSTRLTEAHRGQGSGAQKETRFLFRGPKFSALEDRSITFAFTGTSGVAGTGAQGEGRRRWPPWSIPVVVVVVALGVAGARRYRSMKG